MVVRFVLMVRKWRPVAAGRAPFCLSSEIDIAVNCQPLANVWLRLSLLLALLLSGGPGAVAHAADNETLAAIEQLQAQVQQQSEQIKELNTELAKQREEIRRLPQVAGSDEAAGESAQSDGRDAADSAGDEKDDTSISTRLGSLEEMVMALKRDQTQFLDTPTRGTSWAVNGRIHIDQWGFPVNSPGTNEIESGNPLLGPIDRLVYRRIRMGVGGTVPPGNMSYRVEIEYSGEEGSQFRDAWIGWDDLVCLGTLRLGNQKRPYGLDHMNSSNFNLFMERPFIVEAFNENNRRFGIMTYGASDDLRFNWRVGLFDLNLIQDSASTLSNKYPLELAGRLASTYWYDDLSNGRGYGHFAISGTCAFPDPNPPEPGASDSRAQFRTRPEGRSSESWLDTERIDGCDFYQLLGLESVVNIGSFQCGGEFMNVWLQRKNRNEACMHGGYVYFSYFLTGEYLPWNRRLGILGRVQPLENFFSLETCNRGIARGIGAWEVATRFSYGDLTDDDIFGGVGQSATFALNWYWNAHARLQWNYIFGRIDDRQVSTAGMPIVGGSYQISGVRGIIDF